MTDKEKQDIVSISDTAYKAFMLVMDTSTETEQQFIHDNIDIFLNIFNRTVLITKKLLDNKKDG